jgi:hypothetical protein
MHAMLQLLASIISFSPSMAFPQSEKASLSAVVLKHHETIAHSIPLRKRVGFGLDP